MASAAWRELKSAPSAEVVAKMKLYAWLAPLTSDVTSYSTQLPVAIARLSSVAALVRAVRLLQVIPVSDQELAVL